MSDAPPAAPGLTPLTPLDVRPLFAPLGGELVALLGSLAPADWLRPAVGRWRVREVAAHLLDGALRRLSFDRDGHPPPAPQRPPAGWGELVSFLNRLNASWVEASDRLSPRLLTDLLEVAEGWLAEAVAAVDLEAPARFPVAWAGEAESRAGFDLARELTERWHHQQQVRRAVAAPPLDEPRFFAPVAETFLAALPHRYREVPAAEGAALAVHLRARREHRWTLVRGAAGWSLLAGAPAAPAASIALGGEDFWRLFTKGLAPAEARRRAEAAGAEELLAPFFDTVAVMA